MKCNELKYERLDDAFETYPDSTLVIRKQYVDAAIAELKAENERLKGELSFLQNKACEDVFEGISPSHIECPSLRYAK